MNKTMAARKAGKKQFLGWNRSKNRFFVENGGQKRSKENEQRDETRHSMAEDDVEHVENKKNEKNGILDMKMVENPFSKKTVKKKTVER